MLAFYWVLATPTMGFLFGVYLYVCINHFHVHYDEAFSSLRIPHFKGFSRMHITPTGDLHLYSLAMDMVRTTEAGLSFSTPKAYGLPLMLLFAGTATHCKVCIAAEGLDNGRLFYF